MLFIFSSLSVMFIIFIRSVSFTRFCRDFHLNNTILKLFWYVRLFFSWIISLRAFISICRFLSSPRFVQLCLFSWLLSFVSVMWSHLKPSCLAQLASSKQIITKVSDFSSPGTPRRSRALLYWTPLDVYMTTTTTLFWSGVRAAEKNINKIAKRVRISGSPLKITTTATRGSPWILFIGEPFSDQVRAGTASKYSTHGSRGVGVGMGQAIPISIPSGST